MLSQGTITPFDPGCLFLHLFLTCKGCPGFMMSDHQKYIIFWILLLQKPGMKNELKQHQP
jgi:hypothetical protein